MLSNCACHGAQEREEGTEGDMGALHTRAHCIAIYHILQEIPTAPELEAHHQKTARGRDHEER